jgi:hypothetical protein
VGDEKGKPGRIRGTDSRRSSRMNHPSALRAVPEPRVVLSQGTRLVDLTDCGSGCGKGVWCQACRADIRAEALQWLRELNAPRPSAAGTVLAWSRAWNREILLGDR